MHVSHCVKSNVMVSRARSKRNAILRLYYTERLHIIRSKITYLSNSMHIFKRFAFDIHIFVYALRWLYPRTYLSRSKLFHFLFSIISANYILRAQLFNFVRFQFSHATKSIATADRKREMDMTGHSG